MVGAVVPLIYPRCKIWPLHFQIRCVGPVTVRLRTIDCFFYYVFCFLFQVAPRGSNLSQQDFSWAYIYETFIIVVVGGGGVITVIWLCLHFYETTNICLIWY